MHCAFCGEGDSRIKTCRTKEGSRLRVCDPCWEALAPWLMVVSGDHVVTARCDQCWGYFNPRGMAEVSPGGRKDAYSGTCGACAKEGAAFQSEVPNSVASKLQSTPGTLGYSPPHRGYLG